MKRKEKVSSLRGSEATEAIQLYNLKKLDCFVGGMCLLAMTFTFVLCLTACSGSAQRGQIAAGTGSGIGALAPSVLIAASPEKVQSVIVARAAARGSTAKVVGNTLVLERTLEKVSPEVHAACGDSWFGRKVRVVMRVTPVQGGTQLSEERFIVGGSILSETTCPMPLSAEDMAQAVMSLNGVKAQAEQQ